MNALFGGMSKNRDISDILQALSESTICNEAAQATSVQSIEVQNAADRIAKVMFEHYVGDRQDAPYKDMVTSDAADAAQLFKNSLVEYAADANATGAALSESASLTPNLVTLTASIATTMRTPYEAVVHRMYDTRTLDKQMVEIEEVIPTVKAPLDDVEEDLVDALAPYAETPFIDKTELLVDTLVNGVELNVKDLPLLAGKNPLFRINRDVRVDHIEVKIADEVIDQKDIFMAKGATPYFDAKNNQMTCLFNVRKADGTIETVDINAEIDFDKSTLKYLRGDPQVTKVYFYATVSHHEHTHPIYTSFRNGMQQFIVPTRPHIEVSLTQEQRTDISNSIQHFANTDVVTAMTESITVISSRMEDQRLKRGLDKGHEYEGSFPYEAPPNFAHGNLEWLKREFIPFLDLCALKMKDRYNITDCHFRVGVSPYILRILDTDYTMDKAMTEESRGAGAINYSIGIKTSTSVFYFISSQQFDDAQIHMNLIPNNFKMSQVKTYNYFKYSSFLTDQLRRSDNHTMPAIVYSERNMPVVFKTLATRLEIADMPTTKTDGLKWIKRVQA
ncbi:MAG: hypothetical protein NC311_06770 [Muribaculaceae bacterium]|nr:hypothetical protein [Muribaculaceae bacterium]